MRRLPLAVLVVCLVACMACGGANDGGLFGPSSNDDNPGPDAGTTPDASAISHPDTGTTGTPDSFVSPPPVGTDASTPPPPPVDAAPPPPDAGDDPGVRCGDTSSATYCSVPDQVCCRRTVGMQSTNTCVSANSPAGCPAGLAIPCDDTEDCTRAGMDGDVCCAQYDQSGTVTSVSCTDPSNCGTDQSSVELCSTVVPGECPSGTTCEPSTQTLPGYDICK